MCSWKRSHLRIDELDAEHMNQNARGVRVVERVFWVLLTLETFLITCMVSFAIGRKIGQRIHLVIPALPPLVTLADAPNK